MGRVGTVRLLGIDAPETVHPYKPVEPFGKLVSTMAARLLLGKRVTFDNGMAPKGHWTTMADYLAYVWLENGTLANEWLVRKGFAREQNLLQQAVQAPETVSGQHKRMPGAHSAECGQIDQERHLMIRPASEHGVAQSELCFGFLDLGRCQSGLVPNSSPGRVALTNLLVRRPCPLAL